MISAEQLTNSDAVIPVCIFFFAGPGLLISFFLGKKLREDDFKKMSFLKDQSQQD